MYKAGDKVGIKKNLKTNEQYGHLTVELGMEKLKGKKSKICLISTTGSIALKDSPFWWSPGMLEPAGIWRRLLRKRKD